MWLFSGSFSPPSIQKHAENFKMLACIVRLEEEPPAFIVLIHFILDSRSSLLKNLWWNFSLEQMVKRART